MKLCWDNIENIRLTRNGNFKDIVKKRVYYYYEFCDKCGEPFLGGKNSKQCSVSCASKRNHSEETKKKMSKSHMGENNHFYGKHHTNETKRKIAESLGDKVKGKNNPFYGKHHTEETKRKLGEKAKLRIGEKNGFYGKHHTEETKKKIIMTRLGLDNINDIKMLYYKKGIPTYYNYAHQIEWTEEVRHNKKDPNVLEVRCFKCDEWFVPTINNINNRIQYLNGNNKWENNLYCSDGCKNSCSIFNRSAKTIMKEDAIRAGRLSWLKLEREVQPELRKMVLARDESKCVKCGETENLQCHHIYPVATNPLESADVDNCITLCINCHKEVHKKEGCRRKDLIGEVC